MQVAFVSSECIQRQSQLIPSDARKPGAAHLLLALQLHERLSRRPLIPRQVKDNDVGCQQRRHCGRTRLPGDLNMRSER